MIASNLRLRPALRGLSMVHVSFTVAVLWTCTDTTMNPRASAQSALQIDRAEYVWQIQEDKLRVEIPWTFTNLLPDTLFFKNCRGFLPEPTLEKLVDGEWHGAIGYRRAVTDTAGERRNPRGIGIGTDKGCISPAGIISPGASRSDKTEFRAILTDATGNIRVFLFDDIGGTYRLNWSNRAARPHLYRSGEVDMIGGVPVPSTNFTRPLSPDVQLVSPPFTLIDPRDGR